MYGADLSGLVLVRQAALALWFFWPVSLQVWPDDRIKRHCSPHTRAQLVPFGLSSCQYQKQLVILNMSTRFNNLVFH